ncbi:putative fluoride ion transporter CrcB [Agaricicola taiwanensis]|uniref:Fluoride-specific ion channel FluC n=1 Tax=Agaricicola taiwanensis TaxID=591372 RepID=A0A8J2YJU7_9RHOB|nr:fluoride efflux transporter CrcB [Agaricicola taiwanensis]GGE47407.1 putative fluoride ion transporter CrcB [Agaricicola taiwanensis]
MKPLVLVMIGGGLGAGARHLVNLAALRVFGVSFPWGTFAVNVIGSFLMGLLAGWLALKFEGGGANIRLFLATGVLGGFTTFSAFSLDATALWDSGQPQLAAAYVMGSVVLALVALVAGLALARSLT